MDLCDLQKLMTKEVAQKISGHLIRMVPDGASCRKNNGRAALCDHLRGLVRALRTYPVAAGSRTIHAAVSQACLHASTLTGHIFE